MEFTLKHYLNKYIVHVDHNKFEVVTRISEGKENYIDIRTGIYATELELKNLDQDNSIFNNQEFKTKVLADRYRFIKIVEYGKLNQINLRLDDVANYLLNQDKSLSGTQSKHNTEVHDIAKEIVHEILKPTLGQKRLTKNEQMKLDASNLSAQRKLELLKRHTKK